MSDLREEYVAANSAHARQLSQCRQAAKARNEARRQKKQVAREARAAGASAEGGAAAVAQPTASALVPDGGSSRDSVVQGSMTAYGDEEGDSSGSEASELSFESLPPA